MANLELNMYVQNSTSGYDKLLPTTTAEKIAYVNTKSGLIADDAQSAIDALAFESSEKVNRFDVANNLTTTNYGKVLDARQGKALNDSLTGNKFVQLFSGSVSSGTSFTLQTPQSTVGNYRGLIVVLHGGATNDTVFAYIPQYMLSGNTNLYAPVQFGETTGKIHTIPATDIANTTMKFYWNNANYVLVRIVAEI